MRTTATRAMTAATIPRGWRLVSTEFSRAHLEPTLLTLRRGSLRGHRVVPTMVSRRSLHRDVPVPTPLLCPHRVRPFLGPNLLPRLGRATGLRLW